jgi:hypothetical protein
MKDSLLEGNNPSLVAPAQARKAFVEAHVATLMKKDHIEAGFPSNG